MEYTTAELIAQLYVGYYNRAPDPEGLAYWEARFEAGVSLSDIADSFAASPEGIAAYPFFAMENPTSGQVGAFLAAVYQNMFGRPIDEDGLTYYSNQLLSGERTPGEIIASIQANANTNPNNTDGTVLANKVEVALAWAAAAEAREDFEFNAEARASANSILKGVNDTEASVNDALADVEDFFNVPATLTDALEALAASREAVTDFLEGARDNEYLQENQGVTSTTTAAQVRVEITDEYSASAAELASETSITGFATASAALQDLAIADGRAARQESINDLNADIADVRGLSSAINAYNAAVEADTAASTELSDAEAEATAEVAAFEARNSLTGSVALDEGTGATADPLDGGETIVNATRVVEATAGAVDQVLLTLDAQGNWVIEPGAANIPGIADLQADIQAQYDAQIAADTAAATLAAATTNLATFDDEVDADADLTGYTDAADLAAEVEARATELENFNEDVARFLNARDLRDNLADLDEGVTASTEAFAEFGFDTVVDVDGAEAATAEADLFVYAEETGSITGFGLQGDDVLYIGSEFTRVDLDAEVVATTAVGSASALEFFVKQQGGNTVLYFEESAFQGSETDGSFDGNIITLVGVNADDVSFNNGFISIA